MLFGALLVGAPLWRLLALTQARCDTAQAQLTQAWRDGYTVPTTGEVQPVLDEPVDENPLPKAAIEFLSQWDEAGQEAWGRVLRRHMDKGYSVEAAIKLTGAGAE